QASASYVWGMGPTNGAWLFWCFPQPLIQVIRPPSHQVMPFRPVSGMVAGTAHFVAVPARELPLHHFCTKAALLVHDGRGLPTKVMASLQAAKSHDFQGPVRLDADRRGTRVVLAKEQKRMAS